MTNREWIKMVEEKRDEIVEKIREILRQAYEYETSILEVVLTEEGEIDMGQYVSDSTTDGEVYTGKAISLVKFNASEFNVTDSFYDMDQKDVRDMLKQYNAESFLDEFKKENKEYDPIEFYYSIPDNVREKIDEEIIGNEVDWYFEINDVIENIIHNLEQEEF